MRDLVQKTYGVFLKSWAYFVNENVKNYKRYAGRGQGIEKNYLNFTLDTDSTESF